MSRLLFCFCILWSLATSAQQKAVLMRINGREVTCSEFERFCRRDQIKKNSTLSIQQKLALFQVHELELIAAEKDGLSLNPEYLDKVANYRHQLVRLYLTDKRVTDQSALKIYNFMKKTGFAGKIEFIQIFRYLPQYISSVKLSQAKEQMDSIYQVFKNNPSVDFRTMVNKYSDDRKSHWLGRFESPEDFEDVAFSLSKGQISKVFYTPKGLHIVKVLDQKPFPSFELLREKIERQFADSPDFDMGVSVVVEKLKKEYNYKSFEVAISELKEKGFTDKVLFVLDDHRYTGIDFNRFAQFYPYRVDKALTDFVSKTVLDYEYSRLDKKYVSFNDSLANFREDLLIDEVRALEVNKPASLIKDGPAMYFKIHRSDYILKEPKFVGFVIHCSDREVASRVHKLIKEVSFDNQIETIEKRFNASGNKKVKIEKGTFAQGENRFVDKLVFGKGDFLPLKSFPITFVSGYKQKGPKDYTEVLDSVTRDYQRYAYDYWIDKLRDKVKVEINQEVLKTVNND
ncbi:MAG: peptidylprolyl isomerase [Bacteroidaceae bacterium]|nr:peptidylprolyl isomerase [Bacteroidaceae bacterium]